MNQTYGNGSARDSRSRGKARSVPKNNPLRSTHDEPCASYSGGSIIHKMREWDMILSTCGSSKSCNWNVPTRWLPGVPGSSPQSTIGPWSIHLWGHQKTAMCPTNIHIPNLRLGNHKLTQLIITKPKL